MTPASPRPLRVLAGLLLIAVVALSGCTTGSGTPAPAASTGPSAASAFPVTLEHRFGRTTIPAAPLRVVAIGYNEQDFVLAFGVEPVGVREFLGYDAPNRPWAPESVRGKKIPTVGSEELDLEQVAALQPDLILGVNSYIDRATYDKLARLAPTVAESADFAEGSTPWDEQTRITGRALGHPAKADELVAQTRAAFDRAKAENPDFAGKSAAFALGSSATGTYSLGADDYRSGWLTDLGFTVPEKGGEVSFEQLSTIDQDVLVGEGVDRAALSNPAFTRLGAVQEGRFVNLGAFSDDFAAALGFNSPLSLPVVLDIAVPRLAAATDGDPASTPAPYPSP